MRAWNSTPRCGTTGAFRGAPLRQSPSPHHRNRALHRRQAEAWLKEAGARQTWKRVPSQSLSGGQHQAGTCRMGNDPKTSVVDRDCRVHDVDNVYVIDASVHPTNGGFNPVLTILANALPGLREPAPYLERLQGAGMTKVALIAALVLIAAS